MKLERILWGIVIAVLIGGAIIALRPSARERGVVDFLSPAPLAKEQKSAILEQYKEIVQPSGFVNTDGKPVLLADYVGKQVILLDIMTYSCINCQRTFPYVTRWYEEYKDKGFVVIGIHTPEFAFERDIKNVERAMREFGIDFPVVLDNDYATWNAYGNRYWPRKYLIDIDGYISYDHIGEGAYEKTEAAIRAALVERSQRLRIALPEFDELPQEKQTVKPLTVGTPEIYFGSKRNELLANGTARSFGEQTLTLPNSFVKNNLYLGGTWFMWDEFAESTGGGEVVLRYEASKVYMVASAPKGTTVKVYKDGVSHASVPVQAEKLYTLVDEETPGEHLLRLEVPSGIRIFTFTFG